MAARRLLVVMVVLLVLSSIAAALVPPPPRSETSSTETSTTQRTTTSTAAETGRSLVRRLSAAKRSSVRIQARAGDHLTLAVSSPRFSEISIPRLGLLENAEPHSAAIFDTLLADPGIYAVRSLSAQRTIATIVVRPVASSRRENGAQAPRESG